MNFVKMELLEDIMNGIMGEVYDRTNILFIIYSAGLRVGESVRLQIEDIDSQQYSFGLNKEKAEKMDIQYYQS